MHPPLKNCGGITYAIQVGLPLAKNTKFIVTTWVLSSSECTRTSFRPAGAPPWTPLGKLTTLSQTPSRLPSPLLLKEIYANASPQPTHKVRNICTACIACIDCGFRHSRTLWQVNPQTTAYRQFIVLKQDNFPYSNPEPIISNSLLNLS